MFNLICLFIKINYLIRHKNLITSFPFFHNSKIMRVCLFFICKEFLLFNVGKFPRTQFTDSHVTLYFNLSYFKQCKCSVTKSSSISTLQTSQNILYHVACVQNLSSSQMLKTNFITSCHMVKSKSQISSITKSDWTQAAALFSPVFSIRCVPDHDGNSAYVFILNLLQKHSANHCSLQDSGVKESWILLLLCSTTDYLNVKHAFL